MLLHASVSGEGAPSVLHGTGLGHFWTILWAIVIEIVDEHVEWDVSDRIIEKICWTKKKSRKQFLLFA